MKKILSLLTLLVVSISTSWAVDTTLKSVNFLDATWQGAEFNQKNTTTPDVIDGVVCYGKNTGADKNFSISASGLRFPNNNIGSNYFIAIPLTDINETISVTINHTAHASADQKLTWGYVFKADATTYSTSDISNVVSVEETKGNTSVTFNIETNKTKGVLYLGPNNSSTRGDNIIWKGITVSTPVAAATHSVTYSLGAATGGTAPTQADVAEGSKFTVADAPADLVAPTGQEFKCWNDGSNDYNAGAEYTMGTSNVTLTAVYQAETVKYAVTYALNGGTGTAPTQASVAEGTVFTVASADGITAPEGKRFSTWNDGTNNYAPGADYTMGTAAVTLTAQYVDIYAVTKATPANGSITVSAETAAAGDKITLTATPDFRYAFSAWNVYKTGEPATTVTVTNNEFTMPAYAVTVDATFAADTKKQVLYVTSDGNVNAGDDLYAALGEDYTVTVAANSASKTVTDFDLVVLHESIGGTSGTSGLAAAAKAGDVPVLNTKSYFYNSGRWGWGEPNAGGTINGCSQNAAYSNVASHPIFDGVTVTDGFVQVVNTAAAKAMQPVGTITAGYEGYLLATSPNASSGKGAAIHELTAAERGVASAKYLMISVSNAGLNDLSANGQLLFKNAAAYLMSDEAWTPTLATAEITLNASGYATYSKATDFTFSGAKAYKMALNEEAKTITGTEVTGKIVAGEGVLFKGEAGATVTITGATWATAQEENSLKGSTKFDGTTAAKPTYCYVLSGNTFMSYTGASLAANKAYIEAETNLSNSLELVFDEEATAVEAVAEAKANAVAPVKVIKNGKLFIGNYNVAGQQVK